MTKKNATSEVLILQRRAEQLAVPPPMPEPSERIEVLLFQLAYEQYAIETKWVEEVIPLREITPLPLVPKHTLGLINVRGSITSVLDIRRFFDLPGEPMSDLNRVVLLQKPGMSFGILADRIHGLAFIPEKEIIRETSAVGDRRKDYILGLTADRIIIIDGEALLGDKSIIVKDEI